MHCNKWVHQAQAAAEPQLQDTETSRVQQGLVQVGDDVVDVFNANGETHETFGDADALAHFLRHGGVSHECGKLDKRFHATETLGECAQLDLIQDAASGFDVAEVKRKHGSRPALLLAGDLMLWM